MRTLAFGLLACGFGYAYFVSLSIMNIVAHKEAIAQSDRLQSHIGSLEEEYFALSRSITPEAGERLGLTSTSHTSFVRRPGAVGTAAPVRDAI